MSNVILFNLTTVLFGVASALYLGALYAKNEKISAFGTWVCVLAAVVSTAALGLRWYESYQMGIGRIPVTNLYESLVFFAWAVNLFYLVVERKYRNRTFGAFVMPIAFFTMVFAVYNDSSIQPLVPALQSYWLHAHVITCFVGYAAFAVSAGVALMYLLKSKQEAAKINKGIVGLLPLQDARRPGLPGDHLGLPVPDGGDHHRGGVGELRLGNVLVVGPERDLVPDRVARLRGVPPRAGNPGVARQARRDPLHRRVPGDDHVLPRRQPHPLGAALLRRRLMPGSGGP